MNCRLTPMYQERICEYPFALSRLRFKKGSVADFGSAGSLLVPYLCALGYEVFGVDFHEGVDADFVHHFPNYRFTKTNITNLPFENEAFDVSFAISTLEHMGADAKKAFEEIARVTKKGGQIFISVPFGNGKVNLEYPEYPTQVYTEKSLSQLLNSAGVEIDEFAFFKRQWPIWRKAEKHEVESLDSSQQIQGVVCACVSKK